MLFPGETDGWSSLARTAYEEEVVKENEKKTTQKALDHRLVNG